MAVDVFRHFGIVPGGRSGSNRHSGMAGSTQLDFFGAPFTTYGSEGKGQADLFNDDDAEHSGMFVAVRLQHALQVGAETAALARSQELFAVSNRTTNS